MKTFTSIVFLLIAVSSFSQTKAECIAFIRKKESSHNGQNFVSVNLDGTILKIVNKLLRDNQLETVETEIDFSKAKKIIIEFDDRFNFYRPTVLLIGKDYNRKEIPIQGLWYQFYKDRFEYYYYENQNEAIEMKTVFIQLAKLCGAKLEH